MVFGVQKPLLRSMYPPKQQYGEPHSPSVVHSHTPLPQVGEQSFAQFSQFSVDEQTPSPQKQSSRQVE